MWYLPYALSKEVGDRYFPFYDIFISQMNQVVAIGPFTPRKWQENGIDIEKGFTIASTSASTVDIQGNVVRSPGLQALIVVFPTAGPSPTGSPAAHDNDPLSSNLVMRNGNKEEDWSWTISKMEKPMLGKGGGGDIAISTIIKNESKYIVPWVEYHVGLGFSCIYIYDNGSSDRADLVKRLEPWILSGHVFLFDWPFPYWEAESGISGQITQQNHSVYLSKSVFKWLALTDVDEFIVPMETTNIETVLADYNDDSICAVSMRCNWFGCSYAAKFDGGNYLEVLKMRKSTVEPENWREKCIVKPEQVVAHTVHIVLVTARGQDERNSSAFQAEGPGVLHIDPSIVRFNHYHPLSSCRKQECNHAEFDQVEDFRIIDILSQQRQQRINS